MASVLQRVAELEPQLHALVTLNESALAEARAADEAYRSGRPRPLEGVPIAVKDAFDSADTRTTYGSIAFSDHVPSEDAEAVRLARAAGCVVVGKTSLHELCWGITGESTVGGPARNPWAFERTAGGSSGGSAAAVASAIVPLALGTDTGGSTRLPAAFCGIVGMKPTHGSISTSGLLPLAPSLDHVGVLARDPEDARVLLDVLVDPAPGALPRPPGPSVEGIVVGLSSMRSGPPLQAPIAASLEGAAEALRGAGASVVEIDLVGLDGALDVFQTIQLAEALASHREIGLYPDRAASYSPELLARLELAEQLSAADLETAERRRAEIRSSLDKLLESVEVLVTPAAPCAAPPIEGRDANSTGHLRDLVLPFTVVQSLTGIPACVVRAGFDDAGLPLGVQICAAGRGDDLVLRVAQALYEATSPLQQRWPLPLPREASAH